MQWLKSFNKDRMGAVVITLLGIIVTIQGTSYRMGQLTRMGAGFMPVVYGVLLTAVGIMLGITSKKEPDAKGLPAEWRGWFCIVAGVFAFVIFGHYGGFLVAAFTSVFISALGDRKNSVRNAALLAAGITLVGYLIFIVGLSMPFPIIGWGI